MCLNPSIRTMWFWEKIWKSLSNKWQRTFTKSGLKPEWSKAGLTASKGMMRKNNTLVWWLTKSFRKKKRSMTATQPSEH